MLDGKLGHSFPRRPLAPLHHTLRSPHFEVVGFLPGQSLGAFWLSLCPVCLLPSVLTHSLFWDLGFPAGPPALVFNFRHHLPLRCLHITANSNVLISKLGLICRNDLETC